LNSDLQIEENQEKVYSSASIIKMGGEMCGKNLTLGMPSTLDFSRFCLLNISEHSAFAPSTQ
jgi:hypothetical protein